MKLTCVTAVFNAIKSGNRENLIRCVRSVAALKTEHENRLTRRGASEAERKEQFVEHENKLTRRGASEAERKEQFVEHLIYDGGSTDGTVELLRELEAEINQKVGGESRWTAGGSGSVVDAGPCPRRNEDATNPNGRGQGPASTSGGESGALGDRALPEDDNSALRLRLQPPPSSPRLRLSPSPHPRLRVVSEPDTGIYNALNKGVRDAKGEWFYVLGCDDYIEDPARMDALIADATAEVQEIIAPIHSERDGAVVTLLPPTTRNLRWMFNCAVFPHQGRISRTEMIRKYGGFDERYQVAGDTNQSLLIHLNGETCRFVQTPFAMFGSGGTSETRTALAKAEDQRCVEDALRMTADQRSFYERTSVLPLGVSLKRWSHPDLAVRTAVRWMAWLWVRWYLRLAFYPVVALKHALSGGGQGK